MSLNANWGEMFTTKLSEHGFDPDDIATIYRIEMKLRGYFDFDGLIPICYNLQNIERNKTEVVYYWKSESNEAVCPHCDALSKKRIIGDYYERRIQDVPQQDRAVYHRLFSNKYICNNEACPVSKFIERHHEFVGEHARKTTRFKNYCIERSLGCGCNEAEREIRLEGGVVSNDSIGRYIKEKSAEYLESNLTQATVRVLSIDDINRRKGDNSSGCTVFIDQETHKILIIIGGKTKEATQKVMELFPSAEFLSRDRASAYAAAGVELGLEQVADRFHLVTNAQTAVKDALMASIPANILIRNGDGWVQAGCEADTPSNASYHYVPGPTVEERIKLAGLTPKKAQKYRDTLKLIELADKGLKTADIAKALEIAYKDVQALRRNAVCTITDVEDRINQKIEKQSAVEESARKNAMQSPGENAVKTVGGSRVRPSNESIVEPYRERVIELWKNGGNHRNIYPVLQAEGYTGSQNAIYQYILKLGKENPDEMIREHGQMAANIPEDNFDLTQAQARPVLQLDSIARNTVYKNILKEASAQHEKKPGEDEKKPDEGSKKKKTSAHGARPASSKTSPLSEKILNLIYSTEPEPDTLSEENAKNAAVKKKL